MCLFNPDLRLFKSNTARDVGISANSQTWRWRPPFSAWQWRHRTLLFFVGLKNRFYLVLFFKPWVVSTVYVPHRHIGTILIFTLNDPNWIASSLLSLSHSNVQTNCYWVNWCSKYRLWKNNEYLRYRSIIWTLHNCKMSHRTEKCRLISVVRCVVDIESRFQGFHSWGRNWIRLSDDDVASRCADIDKQVIMFCFSCYTNHQANVCLHGV